VKRKHANAFLDAVNEILEATQSELFKVCKTSHREEIVEASRQVKDKNEDALKKGMNQKVRDKKIVYSDDENETERAGPDDGAEAPVKATAAGRGRSGGPGSRSGRGSRGGRTASTATKRGGKAAAASARNRDDDEDDDIDPPTPAPAAKKPQPRRAAAKVRNWLSQ
jgi:hypothetical protein